MPWSRSLKERFSAKSMSRNSSTASSAKQISRNSSITSISSLDTNVSLHDEQPVYPTSQMQPAVRQDGRNSGFADPQKNQLLMIKNVFSLQIRPILRHFLEHYDTNKTLQRQFRLKKPDAGIVSPQEQQIVKGFIRRVIAFDTNKLKENANPDADDTSYTTNKEYIYMCLRNRKGQNHSDDIIMFAFIHELSHVGCDEQGHTDAFWVYFRLLLAILCQHEAPGISRVGIKYCNTDLRTDPYFGYCQNNFNVYYNPLYDEKAYM